MSEEDVTETIRPMSPGQLCYTLAYLRRLFQTVLVDADVDPVDVAAVGRTYELVASRLRAAGPPTAEQLAQCRQHAELSQVELAAAVGLPVSVVQALEDGTADLDDDDRLAAAASIHRYLDMHMSQAPR